MKFNKHKEPYNSSCSLIKVRLDLYKFLKEYNLCILIHNLNYIDFILIILGKH